MRDDDGPPRARRRRVLDRRARARARSAIAGCRSSTSRRRPPADVATRTARSGSPSTARSTTTSRCARSSRRKGHRLPLAHRHRGDRPPLGGGGLRCVERLDGMFALRDLGRAHARAVPRPRPARHQAAVLRRSRRAASSSARRSRRCSPTPRSRPELDEEAFHHYLTFVCTPAPLTMFEGIRKLAPAERMLVTRRRLDGDRHLLDARCRRAPRHEVDGDERAELRGAAARRSCAARSPSA